jgi:homoaconitase/3-isopropylmalate dehydratase large subunit
MPGKTISEKILSRASHSDARAGELVICDIHQAASIFVAAGRIAPGVHVVIAPASREGRLVPYFRKRHEFTTP